MGHAEVTNKTPFAFEALYLADEEARPLIVCIVKATYAIHPRKGLSLAEKQLPLNPTGKPWGDPNETSYKYEPEVAFFKPSTDVALIGHAYPPYVGTTEAGVTLRVGELEKTVRVIGDRVWVDSLLGASMSKPQPFERIPLIWERAFGGWDRSRDNPDKHAFEPRNPVGTGFRSKRGKFEEGIRLPNLEDPQRPLKGYGDTPPPAGFGFTSPNWQPRVALAGTYGDRWKKSRKPLLPTDFDRRFFNAAAPGLVSEKYLNGDESVMVSGASSEGTVALRLPGVRPPQCRVQLKGRRDELLQTQLDTVIINLDENLLLLLWRAHLAVRNGPHDVAAIEISAENAPVQVGAP
jgi:hypothetical protein